MTLRARVITAVAVIALVLVSVLVLVTRTTRDNLVAQVDEQLVDASASVRRLPGGFPGPRPPGDGGYGPGPGTGDEPALPDGDAQPLTPLFVGVVSDDEVVTVFQPGLRGEATPLPLVDAERATAAASTGLIFTVDSEGSGPRWRILAEADADGAVTVIGLSLESVDDTLADLIRVEVAAAAVIIVALALVAVWVIRLGVRPVKQMTEVATAIADGDLSQRVPESAPGTEAGELGVALNKMLASIELSFAERAEVEARLRRFVADASHELRTPVATIRGYAELYRSGALADEDSLSDAMRRTEQEAIRMGGLVDDLLALARLDQGRALSLTAVDLAVVAADAAADARAVQPERSVTVVVGEGSHVVESDEAKVRQIVANLVGNALVHTPPSATITITVEGDGDGRCALEVADDGPGMPPDVAARAFERFYRADPARTRHHGGSGLGLSIVDATARAHGGTARLESTEGAGTRVRIELPERAAVAAPDPDPAPETEAPPA